MEAHAGSDATLASCGGFPRAACRRVSIRGVGALLDMFRTDGLPAFGQGYCDPLAAVHSTARRWIDVEMAAQCTEYLTVYVCGSRT